MADKAASPMWQALHDLGNSVRRELATVAGALNDANTRMAGGKARCGSAPPPAPGAAT